MYNRLSTLYSEHWSELFPGYKEDIYNKIDFFLSLTNCDSTVMKHYNNNKNHGLNMEVDLDFCI